MSNIQSLNNHLGLDYNIQVNSYPENRAVALFQGVEASQEDVELKFDESSFQENSWSYLNPFSWPIMRAISWSTHPQTEQYKMTSNLALYIFDAYREGKSIRSSLEQVYGKRLVEEVINTYQLDKKEKLIPAHLEIFSIGIAARVQADDLKDLYKKLFKLEPQDKENFLKILGKEKFDQLISIVQTSDFESLKDSEFEKFLNVFRATHLADGSEKIINPMDFYGNDQMLLSVLAADSIGLISHLQIQKEKLLQDMDTLKTIHRWKVYGNEAEPELATSEFLAREVAYRTLRPGTILSIPSKAFNSPSFYTIEDGYHAKKFGYYILKGLAKEHQNNIKFLAKGTEATSAESWQGNFGEVSGLIPYEKHQELLMKRLKKNCKTAGGNFTIDIMGHSQGGAITQHVSAGLAKMISNDLKLGKFSPWNNLKQVNVYPWNSPGYTEKQDKAFAENLEFLSKNPHTVSLSFNYTYSKASYDVVHTLGEVFAGHFRKSNNISVRVLKFNPESYFLILGPHTSPILQSSNPLIAPFEKIEDSRQQTFQMQKELDLLEFYIRSSNIASKIAELNQNNLTHTKRELILKLKELKVEQLNELLLKDEEFNKTEANLLEMTKEEYISLLNLLKDRAQMFLEIPYITALLNENEELVNELKTLEHEELINRYEFLQSHYQELIGEHMVNLKNMNEYQTTTFNQLPWLMQLVAAPIINTGKNLLYYGLSPWVSSEDKNLMEKYADSQLRILDVMKKMQSRRTSYGIKAAQDNIEIVLLEALNKKFDDPLPIMG